MYGPTVYCTHRSEHKGHPQSWLLEEELPQRGQHPHLLCEVIGVDLEVDQALDALGVVPESPVVLRLLATGTTIDRKRIIWCIISPAVRRVQDERPICPAHPSGQSILCWFYRYHLSHRLYKKKHGSHQRQLYSCIVLFVHVDKIQMIRCFRTNEESLLSYHAPSPPLRRQATPAIPKTRPKTYQKINRGQSVTTT